jgi:hypothetical protein
MASGLAGFVGVVRLWKNEERNHRRRAENMNLCTRVNPDVSLFVEGAPNVVARLTRAK